MSESGGKIAVLIPENLYRSISAEISDTGFASVDDYVVYVLNVVSQKKSSDSPPSDAERVTARLKALGYI